MRLPNWQTTIADGRGNVVVGAEVEVRRESDGELAALFSDRDGLVQISNPVLSDSRGAVAFFAAIGEYKIIARSPLSGSETVRRYVSLMEYTDYYTREEIDAELAKKVSIIELADPNSTISVNSGYF